MTEEIQAQGNGNPSNQILTTRDLADAAHGLLPSTPKQTGYAKKILYFADNMLFLTFLGIFLSGVYLAFTESSSAKQRIIALVFIVIVSLFFLLLAMWQNRIYFRMTQTAINVFGGNRINELHKNVRHNPKIFALGKIVAVGLIIVSFIVFFFIYSSYGLNVWATLFFASALANIFNYFSASLSSKLSQEDINIVIARTKQPFVFLNRVCNVILVSIIIIPKVLPINLLVVQVILYGFSSFIIFYAACLFCIWYFAIQTLSSSRHRQSPCSQPWSSRGS